eukprot:TRINITY_DN1887_c0_g2_i1.p1 TRINITY_DN1887_c0_g2~~TRINITY_DN1887_c0_g2_i1.p1  ORF type:complete len:239 (+),score=66.36 TRINITY_DN1887_c0_g2_i1:57-773(+)
MKTGSRTSSKLNKCSSVPIGSPEPLRVVIGSHASPLRRKSNQTITSKSADFEKLESKKKKNKGTVEKIERSASFDEVPMIKKERKREAKKSSKESKDGKGSKDKPPLFRKKSGSHVIRRKPRVEEVEDVGEIDESPEIVEAAIGLSFSSQRKGEPQNRKMSLSAAMKGDVSYVEKRRSTPIFRVPTIGEESDSDDDEDLRLNAEAEELYEMKKQLMQVKRERDAALAQLEQMQMGNLS